MIMKCACEQGIIFGRPSGLRSIRYSGLIRGYFKIILRVEKSRRVVGVGLDDGKDGL